MSSNPTIKEKEEILLKMVTDFCSQYLDEEYTGLCQKLIKKLGDQPEVPFKRGNPDNWAAAVVYAIGSINFLFDPSFSPFMEAQEISEKFDTNNSTVSNKARKIKDLLDIEHFDPEFSIQKMKDENPFNKYVMVDGFMMPLRLLPPDVQDMVRDARMSGEQVELTTEE